MTPFPITLEGADAERSEYMPPGTIRPTFLPLARFDDLYAGEVSRQSDPKSAPRLKQRRVAVDLLRMFLACRIPVTLWGPVGARKTRTIESLARMRDENGTPYQVITIQPSTQDSTIISGIFYTAVEPGSGEVVMRRSVPDVAKQVIEYWQKHRGLTVILADEMTTCSVSQQNAMLGFLTHGKFDRLDISPYISICMAANPEGTVQMVNPLGEAVMNRGAHVAWYGDVEVFLSDYKSGWGGQVAPPPVRTQWFVENLLLQSARDAFRNPDKWEEAGLVPWDMMEHTERSTTNLAEMVAFIHEHFPEMTKRDKSICNFYLVEVTRAIQGPYWAHRMERTIAMESRTVKPSEVIRAVRSNRIGRHSSLSEVEALRSTLHFLDGEPLSDSQFVSAAQSLADSVRFDGAFSAENFVSFWAFVISSPSKGQMAAASQSCLQVAEVFSQAVEEGEVEEGLAALSFLEPDTLSLLLPSPSDPE